MNKKISRGLSGKISDIAKNILSSPWGLESKKPINVEETKNKTKYVSNFWTPLENLVYIANTAVNMNDSPSYIFFENKYGLNFVSLESLYGVGIFQRFIWDNYSGEVDSLGGSRLSIDRDYQRILEIYPSVNFDYSKRLKSGMFGSELVTYDVVTKQYVHTAYIPDADKFNKLNEHPLWSKNRASAPISTLIYIPKYYNNFDGYDDVTNARTIQERQSFMTRSKASRISIVVNGRTDYSVGKKVYVEIPISSQITKEQTEWQNKILSGNYIISAIRHNITRTKHTCYLELAKDSYMVNLNDSK